TTWAEAADWRSVMVADVAGDGRPDIVARTATGNWWAAVSTGVGFTNQYLASWDEAHRWQDVMAGDFAGTGKADLLARTAGGAWVVGESDGTRLRFRHFGTWNEALGWRPVLAATHLHSGLAASGDGLGTALPSLLAPVAYSRPVSAAAGSPVPVAGPASPVAASPAAVSPVAVSPVAASQAVVSPAVALTPAGRIASASASSPVAVTPVAVTPVAVTPATSGLVIADLTKGDDPIELIDDRRLSEPNGSGAGPLDPFAADAGIPDPFADAGLLDRLLALT
ncbi:MAG TPA: VCBS repeat-containing protein, partial [Planctomycetaceae bacterium]